MNSRILDEHIPAPYGRSYMECRAAQGGGTGFRFLSGVSRSMRSKEPQISTHTVRRVFTEGDTLKRRFLLYITQSAL